MQVEIERRRARGFILLRGAAYRCREFARLRLFRGSRSRFADSFLIFPGAAGQRVRFSLSAEGSPAILSSFGSARIRGFLLATRGWLIHSPSYAGERCPLFFSAPTGAAERRKADRKEVQRAGLLLRHSPGGSRVAATCTVALTVADAGAARMYPRRRLRDPAGVIQGLPCPVQKARGFRQARRYRSGLGSCGVAFCLAVGVGSQIYKEPPFPYGTSRRVPGRRGRAKKAHGNTELPRELSCLRRRGRAGRSIVAAGLSPKPPRCRSGGCLSPPGYPLRRQASGLPRQELPAHPRATPKPAGKSYPTRAKLSSIAASLPQPASLLYRARQARNDPGGIPEPAPTVPPGPPRESEPQGLR